MAPPVRFTITLYPQPDTRMAVHITNGGWHVDTHFYDQNRDGTYGPDHLSSELLAHVTAQRLCGERGVASIRQLEPNKYFAVFGVLRDDDR